MAAGILNELYELVVGICDNLYAERQLITKNTVKKIVLLHGSWSEEDLDLQLPRYINDWRLNTLATSNDIMDVDKITVLEAQLCKSKAELHSAQQTIHRLQADLLAESSRVKLQRVKI